MTTHRENVRLRLHERRTPARRFRHRRAFWALWFALANVLAFRKTPCGGIGGRQRLPPVLRRCSRVGRRRGRAAAGCVMAHSRSAKQRRTNPSVSHGATARRAWMWNCIRKAKARPRSASSTASSPARPRRRNRKLIGGKRWSG